MPMDQTTAEQAAPGSKAIHADCADGRSPVADLEEQARAFIRERPVAAVLAAVGLGYLVARLVSRTVR